MNVPVVLVQFPVSLSIPNNLEAMQAVIRKTRPGDIVVFPEGAVSGYSHDLSFLESIDHLELNNAVENLRNAAQHKGIHIWVGSCMFDGDRWTNAALGFTPVGGLYKYHKINLAEHERGTISAGADLPVFELAIPEGILKVGIQICREIRFAEQWSWLARQGAQLLIHINNAVNDVSTQPVWRSHLISHAASLQRFVISVNAAAPAQLCPTMAISPGGQVIDEIVSDRQAITRVDLDLSQVSDWYLDQSRRDVVNICKPDAKERRKIVRSLRI